MLDKEMFQFLEEQERKPLSLSEIRPIAHQLFVALDSLKGLGVLHADIRPENIMLVNKQDQPLRVKLIDFGEAVRASNVQPGMMLQPCGFRAPEVALGLPFDEAIDVCGVGCMLAFLYITDSIFTVCCIYQMMKDIVSILGQPPDHLLHAGKYTCDFFEAEEAADGTTWRLMTPEEFQVATNKVPQESNRVIGPLSSLDDLVNFYPKGDVAEFEDRKTFVDLMKQLLHVDGIRRISPREALHHPFISMAHLAVNSDCRDYLTTSQAMMAICQKDSSSQTDQDAAATDAPPATDSLDDGPTTDPSDGVLVESSNGEPTAAMSSDGA